MATSDRPTSGLSKTPSRTPSHVGFFPKSCQSTTFSGLLLVLNQTQSWIQWLVWKRWTRTLIQHPHRAPPHRTKHMSQSTSPRKDQPIRSVNQATKEFFMTHWQYRCVVHAMIASTEPAHWLPQRDGVHLRPACGRPMKSNGQLLDCITAEHQLCQHAACRKLWAHFSLE